MIEEAAAAGSHIYMGKKRGNSAPSSASRATNQALSLREESCGKTQADAASLLRVQHLQRLAAWASGEAGVSPVGALLGHRLATKAEAAGIPLGASTFLCQRCESVLQPGFNCTIRIKNNKRNAKRCKKSNSCQNSVAYVCHFCGSQNLIRGSGKGIVKGLLSSRKPYNMDQTGIMSKGNRLDHSFPAVAQVESSRLKKSTLEQYDHVGVSKSNLPEDSSMAEGIVSSLVCHSQLAASTVQVDITPKIKVEITNNKDMNDIQPVSSEKIGPCESDVTSQAEFRVTSKFVTPQKNKLADVAAPKDSAEPLKKRSTLNNKGESCVSVTGKAPIKLTSNDSGKNTMSAPRDSSQMAGSSRKRARKGWTTLKQIAEKDEFERKEKIVNFVIPFFM